MPAEYLDRLSRRDSRLHRASARGKIVTTLLLLIAVACTPLAYWPIYVLATAIVLIAYAVARLPWRYLLSRLATALPFLILVALGAPLSRGWSSGWPLAAEIVIRGEICLLAMVLLVATTPVSKLLAALVRLRTPLVLVWILAFMYRYMFVLSDELQRMRRAKLARTVRPRWTTELSLMGNFIGILFVRAFSRAERVYSAMCARGWNGRFPPEQQP